MKKEISVKLRNGESYPSPSQEVREIMMIELKAFFAKELEDDLEPWRDLAACLWFALQNTYFFKKEKVLIKIKEPEEDRENAHFKFNVFISCDHSSCYFGPMILHTSCKGIFIKSLEQHAQYT